MDAPQTPGDWRYGKTSYGSQAAYVDGPRQGPVAPPAPVAALECRNGAVRLLVKGTSTQPVAMRILTESMERSLTAAPYVPASGIPQFFYVDFQPRDPLLDAMAISKGRFAVETAGFATLYLPSWPEVTRVIEDCR